MLERVNAFCLAMMPGHRIKLTIEQERRTRSQAQNAYLWGVCYKTLCDATGQDAEDWHEFMLGKWSGWEEIDFFGQRKLKPRRRSSKLSKVEFAEFTDLIIRTAAENGIYIPSPDEQV